MWEGDGGGEKSRDTPAVPALKRNERDALSARSGARAIRTECTGVILSWPERARAHTDPAILPLTPRRITQDGRVYEELSGRS